MAVSRSDLADLNVFVVIARHRSFRRAGEELGVSTSALSHAMRNLEARLGVRLINRSSRSVVPTHAGEALIERLELGFRHIGDALEELNSFRESPKGLIRLNVPTDAVELLIRPVLPDYLRAFPDMELEITVENSMIDIVAGGYDAGIRPGGTIAKDMIAVPLGPPLRWIVVGSPTYLRKHGTPRVPEDILRHSCIRLRCHDAIYRWEFERADGEIRILDVPGALTVNDLDLSIEAAVDGVGLTYCLDTHVAAHLADGRLKMVLADWCVHSPRFEVYYPSRRQVPHGLRMLVEMMRNLDRQAEPDAHSIAA
ncbi:MAG: LysR family transcriptional regulator [Sphingomonas bacterium]|uniref:LysR family transcriptional regulator n=1 Tax=Sphingomonas bacterium TaxID=1895847 RepID=UPI002617DE5B|nr:LysR family transcriptional regulator [Sphingomonas bacterium]MDB5705382.1 LysR family transcriptional regulator [Sphingomonas bacterium]